RFANRWRWPLGQAWTARNPSDLHRLRSLDPHRTDRTRSQLHRVEGAFLPRSALREVRLDASSMTYVALLLTPNPRVCKLATIRCIGHRRFENMFEQREPMW